MSSPDLTAAEVEAVNQVLQTPYLSIGPRIAEFEERFAAYIGARHAVGVSSGTTGLHLCVIAAGVTEGDLVITTPFSFVSSANVILYERALPVFVDIEPTTLNIDPALVAEATHDLSDQPEIGTWKSEI
jgi:dTDP-4-amino-4,6-dideoxygalactose transaminase